MKKVALMLAVLMVFAAAPGMCLVETVDHTIDHVMESDIRPIEDAGRILDVTNRGVDHTYNTITKPMDPILNPVRKVRDETLRISKLAVNKTWDVVTLQHFMN